VPDDIWDRYREFCAAEPDEAYHSPIAYLAFQRRYLARLTEPIHAFCLEGNTPNPLLTNQYKRDLVERWIFKDHVKQRFEYARIFQGRLMELIFAVWLFQEGWEIEGLEALGSSVDVEAKSQLRPSFSFEVKHLGQDEVLFDLGLQALRAGGVAVASIPVYSPIDYLTYRVFEAARQLDTSPNRKVVVAVLAEYETYFARPLKEGWIDWQAPRFFRKEGDISDFLEKQYAGNPSLDSDMPQYLSRLDQIWFFDKSGPLAIRRRRIEDLKH
jgi:hypothetical protein